MQWESTSTMQQKGHQLRRGESIGFISLTSIVPEEELLLISVIAHPVMSLLCNAICHCCVCYKYYSFLYIVRIIVN